MKKTLLAFAKGNPNVMEWATSPIVYRQSELWPIVKQACLGYFSEKASLCHYYGTARNTMEKYLLGEKVRYKKYFYVLRSLLCCKWIEKYHEVPPMKFEELLKLFDGTDGRLTDGLYQSIRKLLEVKAQTEEKDLNPQIPAIIDFIREACALQKEISNAAPDDHNLDMTALNKVFLSICHRPGT